MATKPLPDSMSFTYDPAPEENVVVSFFVDYYGGINLVMEDVGSLLNVKLSRFEARRLGGWLIAAANRGD